MSRFMQQFDGHLRGLLRWPQWAALQSILSQENDGRWFVYYVGETMPQSALSPEAFEHFMDELDTLLHRDHEKEYFGIAYVDDPTQPTLVKIYDPNNLGASCGHSGNKVLPDWVISREPPADLQAQYPNLGNRRRW